MTNLTDGDRKLFSFPQVSSEQLGESCEFTCCIPIFSIFLKAIVQPLICNKIIDLSKLKAFADGKYILTHDLKFVSGRIENMALSPFTTMFSRA